MNKLAKQHDRRKWWRLLAKFKDGSLGLVGLIVWLACVALALYGLYLGGMWALETYGGEVQGVMDGGGESVTPSAP